MFFALTTVDADPEPTGGTRRPDRLIHEKSPYLLERAYDPVDWYPRGEEAFAIAREEDKPIFLSIGYSTCHWCHVMRRESFQDIAALLNESFVGVKVDREERPDLDHIYMSACRVITGSGGWPLTIVMTPDRKPFFAGTYFPRESRFRVIGMRDLIPRPEGRRYAREVARMAGGVRAERDGGLKAGGRRRRRDRGGGGVREGLKRKNGVATAYVCESFVCRAPTNDADEMLRALKGE